MVPSPSTSAGTSMCATLPQPATGSSDTPAQAFRRSSPSCASAASTKPGTEMHSTTRNITSASGQRPAVRAVITPQNTPPSAAKPMASTPSSAETGKCSRMMSFTSRFCCVNETPKSPRAMLPR